MFHEKLQIRIFRAGVIAVLQIEDDADALPLARALLKGGVSAMELTLRTSSAISSLIKIKKNIPEMLAGVGTVLTEHQLSEIKKAGSSFAVAPGMNPKVIEAAQKMNLPFAPGVVTPSDIERAVELGCRVLKFFPAEPSGGLAYLKSMASPYNHLRLKYIPLGGLNLQNAANYLEDDLILAIGGSWIAPRDVIKNKGWEKITQNARQAMDLVEKIRGK